MAPLRLLPLVAAAIPLGGCALADSLAADILYDEVALPDSLVRADLAYLPSGDHKHRLDLFLPAPDSVRRRPWPAVLFVHGGGWDEGDRQFTFGGEDIYGNVGRFVARRGVGAAVVSYRLQPDVTWREQVADVAAALAFVQDTVAALGGDPDAVVLMGHSAGAQLAAHVAFDDAVRGQAKAPCGLVSVSGGALNLADDATWEAGAPFAFYAARFSPSRDATEDPPPTPAPWQIEASPVTALSADDPPVHVIHADGEDAFFQTQAAALARALDAAGVPFETSVMKAFNHEVGALYLSRSDRPAGLAAVAMARSCP